jgi:hypothetical protein
MVWWKGVLWVVWLVNWKVVGKAAMRVLLPAALTAVQKVALLVDMWVRLLADLKVDGMVMK